MQTTAERTGLINRKRRSEVADIGALPEVMHQAERDKGEFDLPFFLRTFMPEKFYRDFDPDMMHALGRIQDAMLNGGTFAEAMPRGKGKTTAAEGAMIWAASYGHRRFLVVIASDQSKANDTLSNIQAVVEGQCPKYCEAFPEIAYPVKCLEGRNQRAQAQHMGGEPTNMTWKADKLVLPHITDAASSGVILQAKGITSKGIRGLNHEGQRPDFVLLDDPQDDESANSAEQTSKREKVIFGAILGLAGHDKKISGVMTCTVVARDDLAERFLDNEKHPEWQGYRTKLVNAWPTDTKKWEKYAEIWSDQRSQGLGTDKATEYYAQNRDDMDAGADLSSPDLYDKECEISALQHAYNLRLEVGEATFEAEYQNAPVDLVGAQYELTKEMILAHEVNLPELVAPERSTICVAHIDINRAGLHWCIGAYQQDMTGHAVAYGKYPQSGVLWQKNATEQARKLAIYHGLNALCGNMASYKIDGCNLSLVLVDRGYEPQTVHQFADHVSTNKAAAFPFRVLPARGYAAHKYFPRKATLVGRPMEGCHLTTSQYGNFLAFNADVWRETAQRAFLSEPGAPGGFTLFKGRNKNYHVTFAEHITAEKLTNKYATPEGMRWEWVQKVGAHWDWGDALTGCWVGASALGLSASGIVVQRTKKVNRRRVRRVAL